MQFCLIDADAAYREILRYHLAVEWPDASIIEFADAAEAEAAGKVLAAADAILLACQAGGDGQLAEWQRFLDRAQFPPVVLFVEGGDELLAVDAIKAGAASYFPKASVTHRRLIATLRQELGAARTTGNASLTGAHGDYRFLEVLHSTDLATVYRAEAINGSGAPLAVKLLRYVPDAGGERVFDRFLQEFEIIARIEHPNVVRIFDLGVADDHAFIAMEYLGAGRLSDRVKEQVPPEAAIGYLEQIAGALAEVHAAGILHRDLKPANIMFREDDSIALIDFGLAKSMRLTAALTGQGQIFGTPHYMSPEQGHAEPVDERADLYSLGCIFYEMLMAARPFTAPTAMGVIYLHANGPRPRLAASLAKYQPLLDRLLAVDPAARFQSAQALIDAIGSLRAA